MIHINRSYPAPSSLAREENKNNGSYKLPDVTERLRKDFNDKCYICEIKPVSDPEVEHRLPHKGNTVPGRKYKWENLYWSCPHCNSIKNQSKYDSGILDCCKCDPEKYLSHELKDATVIVEAIDPDNNEAVLTAELICEVFNLRTTGIRIAACEVRIKALQQEMEKLYSALGNYKKNPKSKHYQKSVRVLIRKEGAFAAFKRFYVKSHLQDYPDLESCLD